MVSQRPLVSAVIPTYNHAHFLGDAINSAIDQTYPNVEILVVDDGSTDNTQEVISKFAEQVVYIRQENRGLSEHHPTRDVAYQRWGCLVLVWCEVEVDI